MAWIDRMRPRGVCVQSMGVSFEGRDQPAFSAHWGITGTLTAPTFDYQLAKRFDTAGVLYEINVGSVGPGEQFRRGPQVYKAMANAIVEDSD